MRQYDGRQPMTDENGYKYHIQWLTRTTRRAYSLRPSGGKGYMTSPPAT